MSGDRRTRREAAEPLAAAAAAAARSGRGQLRALAGELYWVESRSSEAGRSVVVGGPPGEVADVSPPERSVRSRVHEYGGGAYCVVALAGTSSRNRGRRRAGLAFVDQGDQRIWWSSEDGELSALTPEPVAGESWYHGDLWPGPGSRSVLAVREAHRAGDVPAPPRRSLVAVALPLEARPEEPPLGRNGASPEVTLWEGSDFVACPRLGPSFPGGHHLAWVTWDHPDMPWDSCTLWRGVLAGDEGGRLALEHAERVAGGAGESATQPLWHGEALLFLSDAGGWWQPWRAEPGGRRRLSALEAELHQPDWQLGQVSWADAGERGILCRWRAAGSDRLGFLDPESGRLTMVDQPCVAIADVATPDVATADMGNADTAASWIGSTTTETAAVWRMGERGTGRRGWSPGPATSERVSEPSSGPTGAEGEAVSVAEPLVVAGRAGEVPVLFHAPSSSDDGVPPPLVVHCHGGPTGGVDRGFDPVVQFFTSRGFAVALVDYRGSSGHGRAHRRALDGLWGVADVEDCVAAAEHLASTGRVDAHAMVVRGASAGGLTALNALVGRDTFLGATSWYGVTDLLALVAVTHDFEVHYTDRLVGPLPQSAAEYERRSPVHRAAEIRGSVLVLQGLDDPVVPPSQSESLVRTLRGLGRRCDYLTFPGEGHGFRRAETIVSCLEAEAAFYQDLLDRRS